MPKRSTTKTSKSVTRMGPDVWSRSESPRASAPSDGLRSGEVGGDEAAYRKHRKQHRVLVMRPGHARRGERRQNATNRVQDRNDYEDDSQHTQTHRHRIAFHHGPKRNKARP